MLVLIGLFMVASGFAVDSWGLQTVLVLSSCLAGLAFLVLDRGDSSTGVLGGTALLAGAVAAMGVGSVVAMPRAFYPLQVSRSVNLGFVAFLAGGLAGRQLLPWLITKMGQRKALFALALVSLLPAAGAACTPESQFDPPAVADGAQAPWLTDARLGLQLAMLALCFPLEAALIRWAGRFEQEKANVPGSALLLGASFWAALFGTRVAAGLFLPAGSEAVWVLVLVMVASIIFGNVLGAYALPSSSIGLCLSGACCGPLAPTLLGLVLRNNPIYMGSAAGLALAAGMLGTLVLLPWMDASRPGRTSRHTIVAATVVAILLLGPALVLVLVG
jgi:hypothetical protein